MGEIKYVLCVCTHNAGRFAHGVGAVRALHPGRVWAESVGSDPARRLWPEVIEVMREVHIDLSACRPTRLTVEMQLHADWAVTMSSGDACPYRLTTGDACPYVPTTVDARDIPDPAGGSLDEVREIRDMIDERVRELATDRIDAIRWDETAHRRRLAQLLPPLIDEFSENPEVTGA